MANIWRDPIFDRTYADVSSALSKIEEWKQNHTHSADIVVGDDSVHINDGTGSVTNDVAVLKTDGVAYVSNDALVIELGTVYDLKGCLNLSDITRIEDNIAYLTDRLIRYRYPVTAMTKEWTKDSLPTALDMKRIGDNIKALFIGFITPGEYSPIPDIMLSYEDINALERNLYLLKQLLDIMEGSFIKSGAYKSGAMRLPIRR